MCSVSVMKCCVFVIWCSAVSYKCSVPSNWQLNGGGLPCGRWEGPVQWVFICYQCFAGREKILEETYTSTFQSFTKFFFWMSYQRVMKLRLWGERWEGKSERDRIFVFNPEKNQSDLSLSFSLSLSLFANTFEFINLWAGCFLLIYSDCKHC